MPGQYGDPYRAPCNPPNPGVWPPRHTVAGGCYQHRKGSATHVARWLNVTRVQDYRDPSDPLYDPNGIPPYPRKSDGHDWPDTGECPGPTGSPCHPDAGGEQWCNSWWSHVDPDGPPEGLKPCTG